MIVRMRGKVVRRPSLPLTEHDEHDLALLRQSPTYQAAVRRLAGHDLSAGELTESALLHAVFEAGLNAVKMSAEDTGYAQLAAQAAENADIRHKQARRRAPSWAEEG